MRRGTLTVVGTGIRAGVHVTAEARAALEAADEVLYLVADPVAEAWLLRLNGRARSLAHLYAEGKDRADTYEEMTEEILEAVRGGGDVCAAFYGHPGVFVDPSHDAVRRARLEGHEARMLPGISADACLFADLGIDPAAGCQSYEATDFLIHGRRVDTSALLVLWMVGFVGQFLYEHRPRRRARAILAERLLELYPPGHEAILYESSTYPVGPPLVARLPLSELAASDVPALATLVVPPAEPPRLDVTMLDRLGLPPS